MKGSLLRQKFLDFYKSRGHVVIPSASLVPQNDPTTLFTSSGMQPLIPYLLGESHPEGKRLVDSQKSFRAQDIEEVGDNRHTTFFEMLGNWSLGDYFKQEQLPWVFEFFTKELGLDKDRLHVTVFEGGSGVPKDEESYQIWKSLGVADDHIHYYPAKKNWWSRSGEPQNMPAGEPGGPDSEVFYDFGEDLNLHQSSIWKDESCHVNCDCGRYMEIGNSVFMQYQKQADGSLSELSQKNVDFGGGLERTLAAVNNDPDIFKTDLFSPIIKQIEDLTAKDYSNNPIPMRVIADHLKAATFMVSEGLEPSNKQQGYILRRLVRRSAVKFRQLTGSIPSGADFISIASQVISIYPEYLNNPDLTPIAIEMDKFAKTLNQGLKEFEKASHITPQFAFDALSTYGIPFEVTQELAVEKGQSIDEEEYLKLVKQHQDLSRTAGKGMFKGGLQDHSEVVTKYHTATHLLHKALRQILGDHVQQMGSNITAERLRFDFTHPSAITPQELKQIEDLINQKIKDDLPVTKQETTYEDAIKAGALAFFGERYPQRVTVYSIGDFSREVCGGPHVDSSAQIGPISLYKQESIGSGRRRLYARLA